MAGASQTEYMRVERPLVDQLQTMGWDYLPGETYVPYLTEREHFRQALLLDRLRKLTPAEFEALVGQLLVAMGFEEVAVTQLGGDRGIDVRGTLVVGDVIRARMAIQAKKWKRNVQAPVDPQVRGSLVCVHRTDLEF